MMDDRELRALLPEYVLGTLDPEDRARVDVAVARSPTLRDEVQVLSRLVYAVPEALDPEPVPEGAWERLRDALWEGRPDAPAELWRRAPTAGRRMREAPRAAASAGTGAAPAREGGGVGTASAGRAALPMHPTGRARVQRGRPLPWGVRGVTLALVAALVVLVATAAWGLQAARQRAQLVSEQRTIAYWMRHPDLRILPLQPVAGGAEPDEHLGVICVLPDGRAMMLQPNAAPRAARYVLYGNRPGGRVELGATPHRFLLFDAEGLAGVELTVQGSAEETLGTVRF